MGQYYVIANMDSREALHGHDFGDGIKLMEFGMSGWGTLTALSTLIGHVGGRTYPWFGCRLVVAGDYGAVGKWSDKPSATLYSCVKGRDEDDQSHRLTVAQTPAEKDQVLLDGLWEPWERVKPSQVETLLKGLGSDITLRVARGNTSRSKHRLKPEDQFEMDNPKGFSLLEDLCEACNTGVREDVSEVMADLMTYFRVGSFSAPGAWGTVNKASLMYTDEGDVRELKVEIGDHMSHATTSKTLAFPASAKDVLRFMGATPSKR